MRRCIVRGLLTRRTLVLTRHGQSEWNKLNLVRTLRGNPLTHQFTGWKDPALTELGEQEALKGAGELKKGNLVCSSAHTSRY